MMIMIGTEGGSLMIRYSIISYTIKLPKMIENEKVLRVARVAVLALLWCSYSQQQV
jgi:hypothetical protein